MEDIREGEDSIEKLWTKLHKKDEIPYQYLFKAF